MKRARAGAAEVLIVKGRRLASHLMIQPDAARGVLSDPVLRDQGFLSRVLLAAPDSMAGSRLWQEPTKGLERDLSKYCARILEVFEAPQLCGDKPNELTPRSIALSPPAREVWIELHNEVESDMRTGGRLAELQDVGSKAAEQAARLAGVLAIVDDPDAKDVSADAMRRGCALMRWYLGEALRLAEAYRVPQEVADGEAILKWCRARKVRRIEAATLQKSGPGALRCKDRLDPAIEALVEAGSFAPDPQAKGKARAWIVA